jgi:tetratricopeptide (TPR) repeat protein
MCRTIKLTHLLIITLLLGIAAPTARADDAELDHAAERAMARQREAEGKFRLGRYDEALRLYKEAYRQKPLPLFLFGMGRCLRFLGQCEQALFYLAQYLIRIPSTADHAEVNRLIATCEAEKTRRENAAKRRPPDEDGATAGAAPAAGGTAAPEGHGPRGVSAASRPVEKLGATARPTASPTPTPTPTPAARPVDDRASAPSVPRGRRVLSPTWFFTAAAVATVFLVAGTITGATALSKSSEYKDPETSLERRASLKDSGEGFRTASTATLVTGAALAAGATVLFFFTDFQRTRAVEKVGAALAPSGAGLVLHGRF